MRPLRNNIIIKRLEANTKSAGGIILTGKAQEVSTEGEVIAVGSGILDDKWKRVPLEVKVGDVVLFPAFSGSEITFCGDNYVIMPDTEVLAVTQESNTEKAKAIEYELRLKIQQEQMNKNATKLGA